MRAAAAAMITGVALGGAVAGAGAATGAAATGVREIVSDHWTSTLPNTSSGRDYAVEFVNPSDPGAKPPSVSEVHLTLPPGARFNTRAIAQCQANDAELMALGPAACPAASNLGTMALTFDTGVPGPGRYLPVSVTFFNARDQLIFLSHDNVSGARTVSRATVTATTLDASIPFLPGTPPDGAADRQERATFLAASSAQGNYLTTPPQCPASHEWVEQETYTYRDGVRQTLNVALPCRSRP